MKGVYSFYQNGELIGRSENLLTTAGKRAILAFLGGRGGNIGAAIALGTGAEPATVADKRLTFEVDRATINLVSVLYNDSLVVYKTTIPQETVYNIYEIGLYNQESNINSPANSRILASFETNIENWDNGVLVNTNARIGSESLQLQPAASGTLEAKLSSVNDFSLFTADDNFTVAFTKNSANASSLTLKFLNDAGDSLSLNKSISALANGYHVVTFRKGDFVPTGNISWGEITSISISHSASAGGASEVFLDGIRIEDDDSVNTDYALISRSVLLTPIQKTTAAPLDVEYALEFTF